MPARWPWIDRRFTFDFPVGKFPDLIERFRGTPARVEERVRGLPRAVLTWTDGGWTIQQNVGHLLDLEPLWDGRIGDFLAGLPMLRAADMTNLRTREAGHNGSDITDLLREFRAARAAAVARAEALAESDFGRTSVHPRLQVPMRLVDALCFVCEHDDYHLARIGELIRLQRA